MKKFKGLFALVMAGIITASFAACGSSGDDTGESTQAGQTNQTVTEVVTDESGKVLTTVENGKYVTVTQVVGGDSNSGSSSGSNSSSGNGGSSKTTTAKNGTNAANNVVTSKSNGKESTAKVTTTAAKKASSRYIDVTVNLPLESSTTKRQIVIYINDKEVKKDSVVLDGTDYTYTSEKKYKKDVSVKVEIETERGVQTFNATVGTNSSSAKINANPVQIIIGEDD
ncbi:MAG: hypothetical protein ACI4IE_04295 [Eubacterium sp.]